MTRRLAAGERGQVAQADGLGHGIVAREQEGERAALRLQAVHGPESLAEPVFLSRPLDLESRDVALEVADLRLRPLDARVEDRHLTTLVREALVDGLQLGQERGLALARVGGLGALFLEPLLGLLERALLLTEVGGVFLRLRSRGGRGGEQQRRADDARARETAHAVARPRARSPPRAPSTAPPAMRSRICGSERKTARARPRVRFRSGSRRGAATA